MRERVGDEAGGGAAVSDDLKAFLRARLDEDEQVARAAAEDAGKSWTNLWSATVQVDGDEFVVGDARVASHIVEQDPARVLAEVEAKRGILQILDLYGDDLTDHILGLLALPYAGHPDYRAEEWGVTPR